MSAEIPVVAWLVAVAGATLLGMAMGHVIGLHEGYRKSEEIHASYRPLFNQVAETRGFLRGTASCGGGGQ